LNPTPYEDERIKAKEPLIPIAAVAGAVGYQPEDIWRRLDKRDVIDDWNHEPCVSWSKARALFDTITEEIAANDRLNAEMRERQNARSVSSKRLQTVELPSGNRNTDSSMASGSASRRRPRTRLDEGSEQGDRVVRSSEEEIERAKAGTPMLETTGGRLGWSMGSAAQLSAFRSCARQLGLPLEIVLRAVETDKLARLIQVRKGQRAESRSTLSPGRGPGMGAKSGWQALTVLQFKKDPLL
jgi:hypothetical protein